MKRAFCLLLTLCLCLSILPSRARAAVYPDVPAGIWAEAVIVSAREHNLLLGNADGTFGYGKSITRAQFVTVLCRMFGWQTAAAEKPSFPDLGGWYDGYVEAALAHGTFDQTALFRPNAAITRREMAVMLVRALGLKDLAAQTDTSRLPFTDLNTDKGYIAIAYDIGMVNGISATTFAPENGAKREEAAAMLVRVYEKYAAKISWVHGFYAFSSYSQKELAGQMNDVSFGWSRMEWDGTSAVLNIGSSGSNDWHIPAGYDSITGYLDAQSVHTSLSVYMSSGAADMLAQETGRSQAVAAIVAEAARSYDAIGKSPYAGVTIDFEGLREVSKAGFTAFLTALRSALPKGMTLYCAVQPLTADGDCFDGYDYRAIGAQCDKVILMAHDYSPVSLAGMEGTSWQYNTAPAPLNKVYDSLLRIIDPDTGVEDKGKIALALSLGCEGWYVDENGKVISGTKVSPAIDTVWSRMTQSDTIYGFQSSSGCAWMNYSVGDGRRVFLWYENAESISQKLLISRLLGITGISLWRIGIIPSYDGWNIWQTIESQR